MQRGADIEGVDIYGNTPLGISLLKGHFNYGIILIQKNANVKVPCYKEFPKRIARDAALEDLRKKREELIAAGLFDEEDVEMESDEDKEANVKTGKAQKTHRGLFQN